MKIRNLLWAASFALTGVVPEIAVAQMSGDVVKIGHITDMSGLYADIDGPGGVEAVRMAVADFGGTVNGARIEVVSMDHQNKPDIAAATAREWYDRAGVDAILVGANTGAGLAVSGVAAEKKKVFFAIGVSSTSLTNESCNPYTVHYAYDSVSQGRGTAAAVMRDGGKTWYFLTVDYSFGHSLQADAEKVILANGGKVLGAAKHPLSASDFSSQIVSAQASGAQVLALANGGGDAVNSVKAASNFGLTKTMKLAGLLMFVNDINTLGLKATQGMYTTESWYWNQSPDAIAWSERFFAKFKRMPSALQAADYSAVLTYLRAIKAAGTDDADAVMAKMRDTKINDMYTKGGVLRADGRMVHDLYLTQIKSPAESKGPWDFYKQVQVIKGDEAFTTKEESRCKLWK